jgi:hypothetical protein
MSPRPGSMWLTEFGARRCCGTVACSEENLFDKARAEAHARQLDLLYKNAILPALGQPIPALLEQSLGREKAISAAFWFKHDSYPGVQENANPKIPDYILGNCDPTGHDPESGDRTRRAEVLPWGLTGWNNQPPLGEIVCNAEECYHWPAWTKLQQIIAEQPRQVNECSR